PDSTRAMRPGTISSALCTGRFRPRPGRARARSAVSPPLPGLRPRALLASVPPMSDVVTDPYVDLYAQRMAGMSASEVRALFAVASRPDVVSLAGGMPFVSALPAGDVRDVVDDVLREHGA